MGTSGTYSLKIVCIVYFFGHKIVHVSRELVLRRAENYSPSHSCCPDATMMALSEATGRDQLGHTRSQHPTRHVAAPARDVLGMLNIRQHRGGLLSAAVQTAPPLPPPSFQSPQSAGALQ